MDKRYEAYCLADPLFYDHPAAREDLAPAFAHIRRPPPAGWSAGPTGDWWRLLPDDHRLPDQGWKIHVSVTPADAASVLDTLWAHCTATRLPFKFLRSPGLLFLRNSKYAERGSSGKFATLYPADEDELERTLKQLDDSLAGTVGPYILSDLRYQAGPLYVRYGAFTQRRCLDAAGESVPAIADPDGRLVPDRRTPVFDPPPWAPLPDFLAPHLAARRAESVADLPYRIERALHFSNGGGVYQGTDTRTGRPVVLKEARPHAGLLGDGSDATARLERERDVLHLAAGSGAGPEVLDWIEVGEHCFLVLEYIEGRTLNTLFAERFPLIGHDPDAANVREYTVWALDLAGKVEVAVTALHTHGVVFNDLHLFNIMVRPDDSVALIDFEVAAPVGESGRQLLAARAFQAPRTLSGPAVDRYALACLRLALFLPLTALLPLDRSRARALADAIRTEFPQVPGTFLDEAVETITAAAEHAAIHATTQSGDAPGGASPRDVDAPLLRANWPALRDSLAASLTAAGTPERTDRLFPGDIRQFGHPGAGVGLAHGAAGVLYALHATGAPIPEEYEHWLLTRAANLPSDVRLGLYDGANGIAHVLDVLGHRDAALRLTDMALAERWQRLGPDLAEGLAGIGLNLLHLAHGTGTGTGTGDSGLRAAAVEAGRLAVELLADQDAARTRERAQSGSAGQPARAGLLRGASGPALLFLHLYEHTADEDWLARARAALRMDLAQCTISERDGSMRVSEGWRALPYLAEGSAGIGLVLRRYLAHRDDEAFRAALGAIRKASASRFYAHAGLFAGRAGLLLALADADLQPAVYAGHVGSIGSTGSAARAVAGHVGYAGDAGHVGHVAGFAAAAGDTPPASSPLSSPLQSGPGLPPRRGALPRPGTYPAARTRPAPSADVPGPPRGGPDALDQLRRLSWHAVGFRGTLAFPGDQLHRLSTDLATGTAGVLLAAGAVLHDRPVHLPFLGPPDPRPAAGPGIAAAPAAY